MILTDIIRNDGGAARKKPGVMETQQNLHVFTFERCSGTKLLN